MKYTKLNEAKKIRLNGLNATVWASATENVF